MGIKEYQNMSEIMKGEPDAKRNKSTQAVHETEKEREERRKRSKDSSKRDR